MAPDRKRSADKIDDACALFMAVGVMGVRPSPRKSFNCSSSSSLPDPPTEPPSSGFFIGASTMKRAYSLFTVKSIDEEQRIIEGIATTPSTDRMGDIVEPEGAQFKLPIPLLWQHNSRSRSAKSSRPRPRRRASPSRRSLPRFPSPAR